ncbi:MAG: hypothetical protein FWH12_08520 [Treponema sp.]|nr:hypothetical protein [Treponema sp.]
MKMRQGLSYVRRGLFFTALACFCFSCQGNPIPRETPLPLGGPPNPSSGPLIPAPAGGGGIVEEIRFYTELGTPSSLARALEIILQRDLGGTEYGRVMGAVSIVLLGSLYPAIQTPMPPFDPPLTHRYSRIIREAERGVYLPAPANSSDYLEHVLPFLAIYPRQGRTVSTDLYLASLPDLDRGRLINGDSFLAEYFTGIVLEETGRLEEAYAQFARSWDRFPECFPAALGMARIMEAQGRPQDSLGFLSNLANLFPGNLQVKRQLALAYYNTRDWPRALTAAEEILQSNSRDGEFLLVRAHILLEQGQALRAQGPLDIYGSINPNDRFYLLLRARLQAEAFNNPDAALGYLRTILRSSGGLSPEIYEEASIYAGRLLLGSYRREDRAEGAEILRRLLGAPSPSLAVTALALEDAIRREEWALGRPHLSRLLEERRSSDDLLAAYRIESGQGRYAAAMVYARELYERDPSREEWILTYISALIDLGRRPEGATMIEEGLLRVNGGVLRGRYYFLRSRTRSNEEEALEDLRSSLFEDPQNLDALAATFELYHRRGDERRAVFYLRQALAISPDNARLRPYQSSYPEAF